MIPLKYRRKLPPQWYENQVAELHFEGAGSAIDYQEEKIREQGQQYLLPYATYSLDIWEWIFFGGPGIDFGGVIDRSLYFDGQANFDGSYLFSGLSVLNDHQSAPEPDPEGPKTIEERRAAIRIKYAGKSRFTLRTLKLIGAEAGRLERVVEDFQNKQIHFRFRPGEPVNTVRLIRDVQRLRPVHVNKNGVYKFQTVGHMEAAQLTMKDLDAMTWSEIENTVVVVF